jgi:Rrf2 family transcriptional regulator, iron-sulfur cluster assembly transcription factor
MTSASDAMRFGVTPMIFARTTEYAIRGLAELASRSDGSSMLLDELVDGTTLPRDFTAKIFQKLVKGGILRSAKGRGGGFALARQAHQVTLLDILEVIEGPQRMDTCVVGLEKCTDHMPCPQHDLYKPIRQRLRDYLATTTVADLAASLKTKPKWVQAHPEVARADAETGR